MKFADCVLALGNASTDIDCDLLCLPGTVRLLLRREQVHKLVCNHLVQPDMELKPMSTSETAWCWFSKDYSDNSEEGMYATQPAYPL